MVAHVKSNTSGFRESQDQENDKSYGLDVNPKFIYKVNFSRSMAPNDVMPHMLKNHESWVIDDANHVMVSNLIEMISTSTCIIVTEANACVPKPQGVDESWILNMVRLGTKCGSHNHLC
jgi:hypothetical protein